MTEKDNNSAELSGDVDKAIHDAMRTAGWLLPKSPQEIQRAEKTLADEPVRLPDRLVDPHAVLARPSRAIRISAPVPSPHSDCAERNLAQAARDGAEIPPEVQEQMKRDREAAKDDADE